MAWKKGGRMKINEIGTVRILVLFFIVTRVCRREEAFQHRARSSQYRLETVRTGVLVSGNVKQEG